MAETREQRGWERLHAWWEEYFVDNPIVWLLRRQLGYASRQSLSSTAQELEKALRKAREARDYEAIQNLVQLRVAYLRGLLTPQPFWKRADRWWAIALWSLTILVVIMCYTQGWQAWIQRLHFIGFWFLVILAVTPASYGTSLHAMLVHEREQGTDVFLWLTRLTGRHIAYGAITLLVCQYQVRTYFVYTAPLVWLVGTLMWNSWLRGLWVVVVGGWLIGTFALLWLVLGMLLLPFSSHRFVNQPLYVLNMLLALALFFLSLPVFGIAMATGLPTSFPFFAQFNTTPVLGWLLLPGWWYSLLPPVAVGSLLFVAHPLWGIPQGMVYLGLAMLLLPFAINFAERARLRPEPEVRPDEGEW